MASGGMKEARGTKPLHGVVEAGERETALQQALQTELDEAVRAIYMPTRRYEGATSAESRGHVGVYRSSTFSAESVKRNAVLRIPSRRPITCR